MKRIWDRITYAATGGILYIDSMTGFNTKEQLLSGLEKISGVEHVSIGKYRIIIQYSPLASRTAIKREAQEVVVGCGFFYN